MSSTLHELAEERLASRTAIEQLSLTPVMFELAARPHTPHSLYRAYLLARQAFGQGTWRHLSARQRDAGRAGQRICAPGRC